MGIAKRGIVSSRGLGNLQGIVRLLVFLLMTHSATAQDKGPEEKGTATARFGARVDSLLATDPVDKGEWGLLIVDAETGATLFEKNADDYFLPASNMKLLTSSAVLEREGASARLSTRVYATGSLSASKR